MSAPASESVRREKAQAVLKALRDRGVKRKEVQKEIRAIHDKGGIADTARLKSWSALQSAEVMLNRAIEEFEIAEGVSE
jgi:hypothetical protein